MIPDLASRRIVVDLLDHAAELERDPIALLALAWVAARDVAVEAWSTVAAIDGWDWLWMSARLVLRAELDPRAPDEVQAEVRHYLGVETYADTEARLKRELAAEVARLQAERAARLAADDRAARRERRYTDAALSGALRRIAGVGRGRHDEVFRAAFGLGRLVGGQVLERGEVEPLLVAAALAAGLSDRDARRTVARGLAAGARAPRGMPA